MKKLLYCFIVIIIVFIIYMFIIPSIIDRRVNNNLANAKSIVAYAKNYYGYNEPDNELIDSDSILSDIGYKNTKPSSLKLYYKNNEIAASIVFDNVCYYKNYNDEISYEKMDENDECSIYGIITDNSCFTFSNGIITDYNKLCGEKVIIPEKINNQFVTEISSKAFYEKGLTSVVIPYNIIIGSYAFSHNDISYLVLKVDNISDYAFEYNKLKSININSFSVGKYAFSNNNLDNVTFTSNVNIIDDYAFSNNNLTHVNIVSSITSIGNNAFSDNKISSIVLNKGLKIIGSNSFTNNELVNVIIPSTVLEIGENAFYKDTVSNRDLSVIYNTTKIDFDYSKIVGSKYNTVDYSKL